MLIKLLIVLFLIIHPVSQAIFAGNYLPCGYSTGNSLIPSTTPGLPPGRTYNVSVGSSCDYFVPDMRIFWMSRTGRGWRQFGSIRQIPAPGTRVVLPPGGCANQTVQVTLTVDFHFNNGTPVNPRDDRYCSVDRVERFTIEDKSAPVARDISFVSADLIFSPSRLKTNFNSSSLTDNCSPLSVLQDNITFSIDPRRPHRVELSCKSTNTYRVPFRTRDACGTYSNWATATIRFVDVEPPQIISIAAPPVVYLDDLCNLNLRREYFTVEAMDNSTPYPHLTYSYRILDPFPFNIPPSGGGHFLFCPLPDSVTLRVCAQDCFGNGHLHTLNNEVDVNCRTIRFMIRDTTPPILSSGCGDTTEIFADCMAEMPNLASSIHIRDYCHDLNDVTVYQIPYPGATLNDGVEDGAALAAGEPRPFSCPTEKQNDDIIDCNNAHGIFKSIPVSFILVDCNGNCKVLSNCLTLNLNNVVEMATSSPPLGINGKIHFENKSSPPPPARSLVSLTHQPNPMEEYSDIRITSSVHGMGTLQFYNGVGQLILSRQVSITQGVSTLRISRNDLNTKGVVIYSLNYQEPGKGRLHQAFNKLVLLE